jgi:hypothetical protein
MATTRVCNETTVAPETHARLRAIAERAGMTLGELLRVWVGVMVRMADEDA